MTQNIQQENLGACSIDMVTPEQAGSVLGVSDDVLLQLINAGGLSPTTWAATSGSRLLMCTLPLRNSLPHRRPRSKPALSLRGAGFLVLPQHHVAESTVRD